MKILFVASECAPFIKTGGLADVVGTLPKYLAQAGEDVRVILPKYDVMRREYKEMMTHVVHFYLDLGWRRQYCGVEMIEQDGVTYYFIDNEYYFARGNVYGSGEFEGERFAFFCRAVLSVLPLIGFRPDVLHLNDWQTGMIPVMLCTQYQGNEFFRGIKTVYTIHNLRYQGVFAWPFVRDLLSLDEGLFTDDKLEYYGCANFMKAGIVYSDVITTVSPTYAKEITTAYYGERLDGLLKARSNSTVGILNGIDVGVYDPEECPVIPAHFTAEDLSGKAECKAALQRELGLEERADLPLIIMITRLTEQKGIDLVQRVIEGIMNTGAQMAVLGSGEKSYQDFLCWAAWRYKGRFATRIEHNENLSMRMYAGGDILLMPSRFEPCGLAQMIAMRFGTIPIVRETGGLKDSVHPYNQYTDEGTGFSFANYNAHEMLYTIERAVGYFRGDKEMWQRLRARAMKEDFSWNVSAKRYQEVYENVLQKP